MINLFLKLVIKSLVFYLIIAKLPEIHVVKSYSGVFSLAILFSISTVVIEKIIKFISKLSIILTLGLSVLILIPLWLIGFWLIPFFGLEILSKFVPNLILIDSIKSAVFASFILLITDIISIIILKISNFFVKLIWS